MVPDLAGLRPYLIKCRSGNLALQISAGLFSADVGDANSNFNLFSCRRASVRDNADVVSGLLGGR